VVLGEVATTWPKPRDRLFEVLEQALKGFSKRERATLIGRALAFAVSEIKLARPSSGWGARAISPSRSMRRQ
jgi:hypothetical protein